MKKVISIAAAALLVAMLILPASAAGFTPSVQQKGAPDVSVEGSSKEVTVTSVADLSEASAQVQASVEAAYQSIASADSLEEAAPALADVLKTIDPTAKVEDLVVRDLFHVDVELDAEETVTLKFDLKVEKDAIVIPMLFVDGQWVPVDPEQVTIHEDGSVSVVFTGQVGTLAFVTQKAD